MSMKVERAISIRQPYVELILRGEKRKEYRTRPTNIRGRVFVYASLRAADDAPGWRRVGNEVGSLPTGKIVGTVEVRDCIWDKRHGCYAYILERPRRLRKHLIANNQPQPIWWRPRFSGTRDNVNR